MKAKKIISAATAAALLAGITTGCGANTRTGGSAGGVDVPAGVYIYFLQSAYYDAQSKLQEMEAPADGAEDTSTPAETTARQFYAKSIDGKNVKDWIIDEANKSCSEYAVVEKKFDEYALSLTEEEQYESKYYVEMMWEYGGDSFAELGISQKSYESIYTNSTKRSRLFDAIYSEGGEKGVPDDEIRQYMVDNYVRLDYIDLELKDGEGNLLKSEGKAEIMAMAEDYIRRYNEGEDFTKLAIEYYDYYQGLKDEAAAKAAEEAAKAAEEAAQTEPAETAAPDETVLDEQDGLQLVQVDEEQAEDEADTSAEETSDETAAETTAEEIAAEETTADDTVLEDDFTDAQPEETTASAEETAAETTADTSTETTGAEQTVDELLASHPDFSSNDHVVKRDGTSPSEEVVKAAFDEMQVGDARIFESQDGEHYYLVIKKEVDKDGSYFDNARSSLLFEMKEEDYDALVETWVSSIGYNINQAAVKRYDPEKMFKDQ